MVARLQLLVQVVAIAKGSMLGEKRIERVGEVPTWYGRPFVRRRPPLLEASLHLSQVGGTHETAECYENASEVGSEVAFWPSTEMAGSRGVGGRELHCQNNQATQLESADA